MPLNLENPSLQIYGADTLTFIRKNAEIFQPLVEQWEGVMDTIKVHAPKNIDGIIGEQAKKLVAILGPGAVGKGTIQKALGWQRIINTTTRQKRPEENDGEDYFFMQEKDFERQQQSREFAVTTFREGRGWYGIKWSELEEKINHPDISGHLVVEENAETLAKLHDALVYEGYPNTIHGIYLLPPLPRFTHLLARYIKRCSLQGQNPLNPVALESTLGKRQIKEFMVAKKIAETDSNESMDMDFIENIDVTTTINSIRCRITEMELA